jgi:uncharacterized protein
MSIAVPITVLFIGVFAMIQIPLTAMVGYRRAQTGIQFMDGGDVTILRRMRAHANFTETVPIVLLAMAAAEVSGLASWALWAGGACLLIGRLMHAHIIITKGWGLPRALGMVLTFVPMFGFGAWDIVRALG